MSQGKMHIGDIHVNKINETGITRGERTRFIITARSEWHTPE
jgi:hypothetical protein